MRGLLHCVATVTICLVTKATHLWSIHFVKSVVLPVRTHQNHRDQELSKRTNLLQDLIDSTVNVWNHEHDTERTSLAVGPCPVRRDT